MDKEREALRIKVEELDSRTSPLILIGPGEKGYLHEREARKKADEQAAKELVEELEKIRHQRS